MATILDIGILNYFIPVFIFLFVFTVFFAILQKTKIFGANAGIDALIAFSVAMLFMFVSDARQLITVITPWLVILLVVIMSLLLVFMFLGVKAETISDAMSESGTVWTILIILIIGLIIAFTQVFGSKIAAITQGPYPYPTGTEQTTTTGTTTPPPTGQQHFLVTVGNIVFSPKILGMFLLLIIASQAIRLIGAPE
ncbi:MAG: hypothetical protein QW404_00155 [Candidatus Nanoarchaeia archaeon]